jgi:hypothetical protein
MLRVIDEVVHEAALLDEMLQAHVMIGVQGAKKEPIKMAVKHVAVRILEEKCTEDTPELQGKRI